MPGNSPTGSRSVCQWENYFSQWIKFFSQWETISLTVGNAQFDSERIDCFAEALAYHAKGPERFAEKLCGGGCWSEQRG
jgi:hypothetical protein